jgi:Domain of unknown function (DUF1918)
MPAKKKTSAKKKPAAKKTKATKKAPVAKTAKTAKRSVARGSSTGAKPGDVIVIESEKVGSPPREGQVLEILQGQISVSYRVRWQDGHESVIAPGAGNTSIVPAQRTR